MTKNTVVKMDPTEYMLLIVYLKHTHTHNPHAKQKSITKLPITNSHTG